MGSATTQAYTVESAMQAVKECGDKLELEKLWAEIALDFKTSARELPDELHFAYTTQKETLGSLKK